MGMVAAIVLGTLLPAEGRRHIGAHRGIGDLLLVRSIDAKAVVRFGTGPLEIISVGDRLGRNEAEVREIAPGRVVLEETFTGQDGRPNRALIVLQDGEKAGKRYVRRREETRPLAVRPGMVERER
jgi:hypothetical protein